MIVLCSFYQLVLSSADDPFPVPDQIFEKHSKLLFAELNIQDHRTEHYHEIKSLYEKYTNLKITLQEYQTIFATLNNTALLNKALALGELTTIQYFMEVNYYTEALNNFLQTEKEYHEAIAELYKYQL